MASLLRILLHILRLSHDNFQRKIEEQQTVKTNEEACRSDEVAHEYATNLMNPPPSVENCKELDEGGGGGHSFKQFETVIAR